MGSTRTEMSVVNIAGSCRFLGSCASGTIPAPALPFGFHWCAPPGLLVSSHSYLNKCSKKLLLHFVGVLLQVTSRPLVIASPAIPVAYALDQPSPCSSMGEPSGSFPRWVPGPAPWVLPKL